MPICPAAWFNGRIQPFEKLSISPLDRGVLFAHAAYEVTAVFGGRMVDFEGHVTRLERTLADIAIPNPHSRAVWQRAHEALIAANGLKEGLIYLQVTAGAYDTRDFAGPVHYQPTAFLFADARPLIGDKAREGIKAIFLDDMRWKRRDMKTTQLLSQALAYREAKVRGADTAFMVEDGFVTEAASANAWIVTPEGELITRELSHAILGGITRAGIPPLLEKEGLRVTERAFTPEEVLSAVEAFTSSAGAMIAPVISVDGAPIGDGKPGPVTRRVQRLYYEHIGADVERVASWVFQQA